MENCFISAASLFILNNGVLIHYINTKSIDISLKNKKELRKLYAKAKKIEEKSYNNEQHFQKLPKTTISKHGKQSIYIYSV